MQATRKSALDCLWLTASLLAIASLLVLVIWLGYLVTLAGYPILFFAIVAIAIFVLYRISPYLYPPPVSRVDTNLEGVEDFSFSDAYLLAIREGNDFELDMYVYLCGNATLVFPNAKRVHWIEKEMDHPTVDPDGSVDYGEFAFVLRRGQGNTFVVKGDFGKIEIESEYPFVRRASDFSGWK